MKLSGERKNLLILAAYLTVFPIVTLLIGFAVGKPLIRIEASNIHLLLETFGIENHLVGGQIYVPADRMSFEITWQCSGAFSMTLYTLIYLLLPGLKKKPMEWLFGVSAIYIANILRVFFSIYLYYEFGEGAFNTFHYTVGPILLFLLVVILIAHVFLLGLRSSTKPSKF
ncbi:archaeosortase family protein ArtF [Thermococcus pacificus]|uniref:Archaeosortase family protein ArtF n=1 Tax=Thermococcus pacificus TaxID=71998 RepID=A0A218P968_9EURY|nr:archaeosortase family protein ArtF [Thermococcus pacificus]ASJ07322.1 archaeosortase family protein ArtF [Thermococcus pacificus]